MSETKTRTAEDLHDEILDKWAADPDATGTWCLTDLLRAWGNERQADGAREEREEIFRELADSLNLAGKLSEDQALVRAVVDSAHRDAAMRDARRLTQVVASEPACAICGKPAACKGAYEDATEEAFACDECCGHGNEDGHCRPIAGR